jgi:3'-phosphoadenosine 5'-phosphosulfate (PAPS) 3'-phosphatase
MTKKRQEKANPINVNQQQKADLFDTMCSNSHSKEACQRFVDKLENGSQSYVSKSA